MLGLVSAPPFTGISLSLIAGVGPEDVTFAMSRVFSRPCASYLSCVAVYSYRSSINLVYEKDSLAFVIITNYWQLWRKTVWVVALTKQLALFNHFQESSIFQLW